MGHQSRQRPRAILACVLGVAAIAVGLLMWSPWAERGADMQFDARVEDPAFVDRHPRVLFDQGHHNAHSIKGRYQPFADLLRSDGCTVRATSSGMTKNVLSSCDVLVIVNACGPESARTESAFTDDEISQIKEWVAEGGGVLLVADHHPYGSAAAPLAEALGIGMMGGWCDDEANLFPGTADSGAIAFTRTKGMLGTHAILAGRGPGEAIESVVTFTGQSLIAPAEAFPLLVCAPSAIDRIPTSSKSVTTGTTTTTTFETEDSSAAGHYQGVAIRIGRGRAVVLGEGAMLTAQIDSESGLKFGMNVAGADNRQFALNVARWLAGGLAD